MPRWVFDFLAAGLTAVPTVWAGCGIVTEWGRVALALATPWCSQWLTLLALAPPVHHGWVVRHGWMAVSWGGLCDDMVLWLFY